MIEPDDPRHGTISGHDAHRRISEKPCEPCRVANVQYQRRGRELRGVRPLGLRPAVGTQRRIQALMALGWSGQRIAQEAGIDQGHLWHVMRNGQVTKKTAAAFHVAYDRLSMRVPSLSTRGERIGASKARNLAARRGWAPPLAWDDIDNDPEPSGMRKDYSADYDSNELVDDNTVDRILAGETLRANYAEKREAMRRWLAAGNSERSLCIRMGWKDGRYTQREGDAA